MSKKTISWLMMVAGVLLFVVSLAADYIRVGSYPGINYAQITGAVVGIIILLIGIWYNRKKIKKEE